jgi:GH35 family endo-1,4-beta-xylanase
MAWSFVKAVKRGNKVAITLRDDSDPDNPQEQVITWGKSDDITWARFKAMVRRETKAYIQYLNSSQAETDVTDDYKPKISA